jgi:hypothetical protein
VSKFPTGIQLWTTPAASFDRLAGTLESGPNINA